MRAETENRDVRWAPSLAWVVVVVLSLVVGFDVSAAGGRLTGILGMDDRVPVESAAWPWSAIGRVDLPTGGFCTGALIGSRHVLTAAHCLYDQDRLSWFAAADLSFATGFGDGAFVRQVAGSELVFAIDEARYRDVAIAHPTLNWAILILQEDLDIQPIPWRVIGPAALSDALEDGAATLVRAGYSEGSADRLSAHLDCDLAGISRVNGMLLHGCDATLGDAGSPILLMRPGGGADLLAIDVAVQHDSGATVGVAVPASAFDAMARRTVRRSTALPATH